MHAQIIRSDVAAPDSSKVADVFLLLLLRIGLATLNPSRYRNSFKRVT